MSRGQHETIPLFPGWWGKVKAFFKKKRSWATEEEIARECHLSSKTISRWKDSDRMTVNSFNLLVARSGYDTAEEFLTALGAPAPTASGRGPAAEQTNEDSQPLMVLRRQLILSLEASTELDRRCEAWLRHGLYDAARELASQVLAHATAGHKLSLMAHWAHRVADAYRSSGTLRRAVRFYAKALDHAEDALEDSPGDEDLRYQQVQTRFGQIIVDAYLMRGAFQEAYQRHEQLLKEADSLLAGVRSESLKAKIPVRRTHIKRQQAEMLRLLGRYGEALQRIREVLREYPESAFEPRIYGRLGEADCLRLQGDVSAALAIYTPLEKLARDRDLQGLLGSVLYRKADALQCQRNLKRDDLSNCIQELGGIAEKHSGRYRFMGIYSLLVQASGKVGDPDAAHRALVKAESSGPLRPDYLVAEYAHAALCRAELLRTANKTADARGSFLEALKCYVKMDFPWGVVRAWIGVQLTAGEASFPAQLEASLEGMDAELLSRFKPGEQLPPGILSANLP